MSLFILIHGESGSGKTRLADTAPGPRLFLDFEMAADFTPSSKVPWDPARQEPNNLEVNENTTVVVTCRDYDTYERVFQWLNSGVHPFRSVILDSLPEFQKRIMDKIAGVQQMKDYDWGTLLRYGEGAVRALRDLKKHPTHPLDAIVMTASTSDRINGVFGPHLVGQLGVTIKAYPDVIGYLALRQHESGWLIRTLQIMPLDNYVAKDRTDKLVARYGKEVPIAQTSPDGKETQQLATIETLLQVHEQGGTDG